MPAGLRLAELTAALSTATDYGMGQPVQYAQAACVLGMRLGASAGLAPNELRDVYFQALLRFIGCNAETHAMAAIVGNELALRTEFAAVDAGNPRQVLPLVLRFIRQANAGASPFEMGLAFMRGLTALGSLDSETFPGHCEVAQRFAARLGLGPNLVLGLGQLYARWDGRGVPRGVRAEQITLPVRVVMLAQDMVTFVRLGGRAAAVKVALERRGRQYDPRLVDLFVRDAEPLLAGFTHEPDWRQVLDLEPEPQALLDEAAFDAACAVLADFADIKSPYTLTHSQHVAMLAEGAAQGLGLDAATVALARRAGLLHDIGRVAVSAGIWAKPAPLSEPEWERVRLHSYCTERILGRFPGLARLAQVASFAHERLDGSGYFRGAGNSTTAQVARIVAAADVLAAVSEARPHRPALPPAEAAALVRAEVAAGRLDSAATEAVLAAAGVVALPRRQRDPAGLTDREIDVVRALARGATNKMIARELGVSPKTVDNQVQSIYPKLGVRTRAGATLAAMERGLLA